MAEILGMSSEDVIAILKLFIAAALGAIVGLEREYRHKPAGLRTHILVCIASCLFVTIGSGFYTTPDSFARMAAAIATGLGFIGAGNIFVSTQAEKTGDHPVQGLTTAASIWMVGAIGVCVGMGKYFLAVVASLLTVSTLLWISWDIKIEAKANGKKREEKK
ncbi:MAG: MgtC/SapB family protein [Candidatus Thermoplasmatota archaeon]|nr:MgtC/SapB family protein [Candidatus Thermoplasmatota archaeon]